jgi:hypothetical protein
MAHLLENEVHAFGKRKTCKTFNLTGISKILIVVVLIIVVC